MAAKKARVDSMRSHLGNVKGRSSDVRERLLVYDGKIIKAERSTVQFLTAAEKKKLGFSTKATVVRRTQKKGWGSGKSQNLFQSLACLLHPKLFPRVIASEKRVAYSELVKLDRESQEAIDLFYDRGDQPERASKVRAHLKRIHSLNVTKVAEAIEKQSGLELKTDAANVGIRPNGRLVFFSVYAIHLSTLEKRVATLSEKTDTQRIRKKAVVGILKEIKRSRPQQEYITLHSF